MFLPSYSRHSFFSDALLDHLCYCKDPKCTDNKCRERWRHYDHHLWDLLCGKVCDRKSRHVRHIERSGLLPNTIFYPCHQRQSHVPRAVDKRRTYFDRFFEEAKGHDLVFFDPDNGMEVPSVAGGNSDKHLYFDEIERAYGEGQHSLLIYQNTQNRKKKDEAERERVTQLRHHTGARCIYAFRAPYVTFYLVIQPRHEARFEAAAQRFEAHWRGFVEVRRHCG